VIDGNIHLSSDLRRLAFVRLFVWLTSHRTRMSREVLVSNYRNKIQNQPSDGRWNVHPSGVRPGKGMGSSERSKEQDVIAFNHLTLAQNLQFIRKGETLWDKNGYILANLSTSNNGRPLFYDGVWLNEALQKEGFIATLGKGEQFVFSSSLLELDVDRILPLLSIIKDEPTANIANQFLASVDKWLEKKAHIEMNSYKRGGIEAERRSIKQKISRLDMENRQPESVLKASKSSHTRLPSVKLYCQEQTYPRLHFLWDLDYIDKNKRGFCLTEKGSRLKGALVDPLYEDRDAKKADALAIKDEISLLRSIVDLSIEGLPRIDFDRFKSLFSSTASFYTSSGVILLSYFNVFRAVTSRAIEASTALSLELFDNYMSRLAEHKEVTVSTTGRGTKYIKVYGSLKPT